MSRHNKWLVHVTLQPKRSHDQHARKREMYTYALLSLVPCVKQTLRVQYANSPATYVLVAEEGKQSTLCGLSHAWASSMGAPHSSPNRGPKSGRTPGASPPTLSACRAPERNHISSRAHTTRTKQRWHSQDSVYPSSCFTSRSDMSSPSSSRLVSCTEVNWLKVCYSLHTSKQATHKRDHPCIVRQPRTPSIFL